MDHHEQAVAIISAKVRTFYHQKQPFRIYHGATNSTRKTSFQADRVVDISRLSRVLNVNSHTKTAVVEPNVSMGPLVRATLNQGLIPPVVPEFPAITVGGAFSGTAGESASFKHGFFDSIINWIQVVLANGQIILASEKENADLFYGAAGSFGTFGVITAFEIQLIHAQPFVQLTYLPVHSLFDAVEQTKSASKDPSNDFVDAIQFSKHQGVIVTGCLSHAPGKNSSVQRFSRAKDPWFYIHVANKLKVNVSSWTEAVPIVDYLFRYDRGAFWAAKPVFTYFATPFNDFTRWASDGLMHTKTLYHGLHENGMAKDNIIQDLALPASQAQDFMEWLDVDFGIYPLWLCPVRQTEQKCMNPHTPERSVIADQTSEKRTDSSSRELLLSIGVWGPRLPNPKDFVAENQKIERKVRELGGFKWLYAHCHYTEAEFWEIYDAKWYHALRAKYHATYLPTVYDKIKFDWDAERRAIEASWLRWLFSFIWWIWPVPGIYGVICVLMQSDYLLNR